MTPRQQFFAAYGETIDLIETDTAERTDAGHTTPPAPKGR